MKWPPCALTCPFTSSNRKTFRSKVSWTVMVSRRRLDQWEFSEDHLTTLSIKVLETATSRKTGTTTQPKATNEYIKQWRIQGRGPPPLPPFPLFLDETEVWRAENNVFWDRPPPTPIWRSGSTTVKHHLFLTLHCTSDRNWIQTDFTWK